jgi:predicted phosphodiesterase
VRYAVLSDVHANLPALRTVLDSLQSERVDGYLVTGDVVGYGAHPNECIELLASLDAVCVAGNHDLIAIGALPPTRAGQLARRTLEWTTSVLSPAGRDYLAALPRSTVVGDALLAHGSTDDPEEYVTTPQRADDLLASAPTRLLLLGHTHHTWAHGLRHGTVLRRRTGVVRLDPDDRWLLNSGSVGQSRDQTAAARLALLDVATGRVTFLAVRYDVDACRRALVRAGLPPTTYHLRPSRARRRTRLIRLLRGWLR